MSTRIAFIMIFVFFHLLGAAYYVFAPTQMTGVILWIAFVVLGAAAGRKAVTCHVARDSSAAT